jgi:hypothetical protein
MRNNKSMAENTTVPQMSQHQTYMLNAIDGGNVSILPDYLHIYKYPDVITAALDNKKQEILDFMFSQISKNKWENIAKLLYGLKYQKLTWPELDTISSKIKAPCIRYFLRIFRDMEYEEAELKSIIEVIRYLHKADIQWPELDIVKDTADSELDKITPEEEEEEVIDEPYDRYYRYRDYD